MTNEEKFTAIIERLKVEKCEFDPQHISAMVIIGYLDDLVKKGLIESAFSMLPNGQTVFAICEEFDWKPSDNDIFAFVKEFVEEPDRAAFAYLVKRYRDDRKLLLEEFEKFKGSSQNE